MRQRGPGESGECAYNVVICGVKLLEETGGAPTAPEDDQSLLCWVMGKLQARSAFLMSDIIEASPSYDHGADGKSTDGLESPSPPRNPSLTERTCRR